MTAEAISGCLIKYAINIDLWAKTMSCGLTLSLFPSISPIFCWRDRGEEAKRKIEHTQDGLIKQLDYCITTYL